MFKTGLVLIVAMSLGSVHAAAQTDAVAGDGQALLFSASVATGYDDDVTSGTASTPSSDPRLRASGTFVMTDLALSYGRQSRRINFGGAANASVRRYQAIEPFTADTYGGSAGMSATIAPRLRLGANASASRSSHYTLTIFPVFVEDPVSPVAGPSLDYNLGTADLARHHGGVQLNYSPTRRSNVNANYSVAESRSSQQRYKLNTIAWGGGYSHGLTQYATLRLGFRRQQGTYGEARRVRRVPVDSYDIGVNYSRPLSFSRRTTMRFGAGTAVVATSVVGTSLVGTSDRRTARVIGHAILTHRFSRAWDLNASYNRAVGFIEGFEEPAKTDTVVSALVGKLNRRVTVTSYARLFQRQPRSANGELAKIYDLLRRLTNAHISVPRIVCLRRLRVLPLSVQELFVASVRGAQLAESAGYPDRASLQRSPTLGAKAVLPGKTYVPEDFIAIAWRRKWVILLPWFCLSVATIVFSHYLPDQYRSETVILVVPQQVPQDYVRSTITTRIEDRLNTINQQILSRTRLERIITEFNLYENERRNGIMEDVVQRMRTQDIGVETLKGDAFRVSYVGSNPQVVMKVTDRLASMFIDENLRDRENLAEGTSSFLTAQLDEARRRLIEQEKKLEVYRSAHAGELPSQADTNLQMVQNTQMQIQQLVESINRDRDQRHLVERALADMDAMASSGTIAENIDPSQQSFAWQLATAQRMLQEMSLRLKPEHPDIQRLKRGIEGLRKRAEEEALSAPLSPEAGVGATPAQVLQNNRRKELQQQLENIDRQMAAKRAEEIRLRGVGAVYQARLEAVPTRETELSELTRDYSTLQSMYSSLLSKNEESKIAASLERRQIGEQFKILDPAKTAERPFSPNRQRINIVGAVAGLCFGLCLAGLLEYKDTAFRTGDDVIAVLGLPVLAQIPIMLTSRRAPWTPPAASAGCRRCRNGCRRDRRGALENRRAVHTASLT